MLSKRQLVKTAFLFLAIIVGFPNESLALSSNFSKQSLVSINNNARCNDSSEAVVYVQLKGTTKDWLVHLDGGGGCFSDADCAARPAADKSSSTLPATKRFHGILDDSASVPV